MARDYVTEDVKANIEDRRHNVTVGGLGMCAAAAVLSLTSVTSSLTPAGLSLLGAFIPCLALFLIAIVISNYRWIESERVKESERRNGAPVLGMPPKRNAFDEALVDARRRGKSILDRYLVGFELDSGDPIWVTDDEICSHGAVFAKTGVGKTLWLEGLMFQQMARGRASGFTFIDAKRDPGTLADIIMMALITGRIEDIVVVDPFDPVCAYNFVFTTQRPDVKARKVLRCGLPPTSDQSTTKHYDRLAADAVYRVVRAMESLGLAWSVRDIAVALSAFTVAYPRMRELLHEQGAKQAMVELGHLAGSYRTAKGSLDSARLTDNLRGIASELHSIANSEAGEMFCVPRADLSLTDAILRGKLIYYMLPRLEEAESAARMVKVFREDLEVSIGEITSSRTHHLEDPHLVIIDEGASTFGPTWANLFELARKGRFALLFGAQSIGGLMDQSMGLSKEFYERVIANVNLKVIMRLGDNRTAEDMSEWIGMVNTTKKTIAAGVSSSLNSRELTKHIEFNRRSADGIRDGLTFSEDEKALVSPEELKHEMSAEKGLAWFDKGDGRLRKGRALWFHSDLPATWEGREYLTRYESVEADEIGLAEWVDEHILSVEREETIRSSAKQAGAEAAANGRGDSDSSSNTGASSSEKDAAEEEDEGGPFRLNLLKGFRGMGRSRTTIAKEPAPKETAKPAEEAKKEEEKPTVSEPKNDAAETESKKEASHKPNEETLQEKDSPSAATSSEVPPAKKSGLSFSEDKDSKKQEETATTKVDPPKSAGPNIGPKPARKRGLSFKEDKTPAPLEDTSSQKKPEADSTAASEKQKKGSTAASSNQSKAEESNTEQSSQKTKRKRRRKRSRRSGNGNSNNGESRASTAENIKEEGSNSKASH